MNALRLLIFERSGSRIETLKRELQPALPAGSLIEVARTTQELATKLPLFKPDTIIMNFALSRLRLEEQPLLSWLQQHSPAPVIVYGMTSAKRPDPLSLGAHIYGLHRTWDENQTSFYTDLRECLATVGTTTKTTNNTVGPSAVVTRELWRATKADDSPQSSHTATPVPLAKYLHLANQALAAADAQTAPADRRHREQQPLPGIPAEPAAMVAATLENAKAARSIARMTFKHDNAPAAPAASRLSDVKPVAGIKLIAIGSSTGGTDALSRVISRLSPPLPGIVIVQHIPPMFSKLLAKRLNDESALTVQEAATGDEILPNHVYIAPGSKHMTLTVYGSKLMLDCRPGPPVHSCCPSVDVLFDSIAASPVAHDTLGIILTGMGHDGAKGLLKLHQLGAPTIGQDEGSSIIYGMPKTAFDIGAVEHQLPLRDIPAAIMKVTQ